MPWCQYSLLKFDSFVPFKPGSVMGGGDKKKKNKQLDRKIEKIFKTFFVLGYDRLVLSACPS